MTLHDRICELSEKHGSLRAAARAIKMDAGYMSRLASGEKMRPSKATIKKLGLREIITYEKAKP